MFSSPVLSEEELQILQEAAARGDAESMTILGRMLLEGDVVEADPDKAAEYFLKAAEQGDKDGPLGRKEEGGLITSLRDDAFVGDMIV
eukprot:s722_g6.t1